MPPACRNATPTNPCLVSVLGSAAPSRCLPVHFCSGVPAPRETATQEFRTRDLSHNLPCRSAVLNLCRTVSPTVRKSEAAGTEGPIPAEDPFPPSTAARPRHPPPQCAQTPGASL